MKMTITDNGGFKAVAAQIDGLGKQMRFATAVALTRTAQQIKAAEEREIKDVFDRPTPYTMQSVYMRSATKQTLMAEVWLKDFGGKGIAASEFLASQITGGGRKQKRFERALYYAGVLPQGYRAVPGTGAKLDAWGNMNRGQIVQILSYFKAFPEQGYHANMKDKRRASLARGSKTKQGYAYFVGRPGDRLPLGVWQRVNFAHGTAIKPILIFVPSVLYEAVFDFAYVARTVFAKAFDLEFEKAYQAAMRSAR